MVKHRVILGNALNTAKCVCFVFLLIILVTYPYSTSYRGIRELAGWLNRTDHFIFAICQAYPCTVNVN